MYSTVTVNGEAALAKLDTGSSTLLTASWDDAQDLELRLERV